MTTDRTRCQSHPFLSHLEEAAIEVGLVVSATHWVQAGTQVSEISKSGVLLKSLVWSGVV